jgi:ATP-dependent exoDNAse (exonuclease V) alpha subunit
MPTEEDVRRILLTEDSVAPRINPVDVAAKISKPKPIKRGAVAVEAVEVETMPEHCWLTSTHRVGLSEQQQEAFDLVHEWFFGENPESFLLSGFAGTGKSFTAQRIAKSIQEIVGRYRLRPRFKVGLCAPTHKAVEVLESFAERAELGVQVNTIHSFLHVAPGEFEADGKQKLIEVFSKADHYDTFGLMVADESSMIGSELLAFIPKSVPTLFMGDPAQLPPVTPDEAPTESPVFAIQPSYQLTHVMRYDGGILAMATDIRTNLDSQHCPPIPRLANNLIGLGSTAWESELLSFFSESDFAHNPNAIRAIAYRNARVSQLNQMIRAHLYPSAAERYEPGEILMANEPIFVWLDEWSREEIVMQTCQECTVLSVCPSTALLESKLIAESVSVQTLELSVESRGAVITVQTLRSEADEALAQQFLNSFKKEILKLGKDKDKQAQKQLRKEHWKDYFWLMKELNIVMKSDNVMQRLQYAYCLTIHKSQGSTIENVFADFRDINASRDNRTKNQLRYVALTRAAEAAFILK